MATHSARALLAALRQALIADATLTGLLGGDRVHDVLPDDAALPAIVFAAVDTRDWSTQTLSGHEHIVTLEIWSDQPGRGDIYQIIGELDRLIDNAPLVLTDHILISLRVIFWSAIPGPEQDLTRGVMRLRAVTEPL